VAGQTPDLEPLVAPRDLPDEVRALRDLATVEFARRDRAIQPRIDAHLDAYAGAVERVVGIHRNIGSGTDLVIGADTRWSAIWELSGRCLAECRLVIHVLRGGFALESASNVRAMFEAMYLLSAVEFDDATARRWLTGAYVKPSKGRAVMAERERYARTRMPERDVEPAGGESDPGPWLYDNMSKSAHHRRGPITGSISVDRREFAYGPHPDAAVRGREVANAGQMVEPALMVVVVALAWLVGSEGVLELIEEQKIEFERVRVEHPLDD
jgi:hypothetical protein